MEGELPPSFYERLIKDIPKKTWLQLIQGEPALKRHLCKGFPGGKLHLHFDRPALRARLHRLLRSEPDLLERVLDIWQDEQPASVSFLAMMDEEVFLDRWRIVRDFMGPERLRASLQVLDLLEKDPIRDILRQEDFWTREARDECVRLALPACSLLKDYAQQNSRAAEALVQFLDMPREGPHPPPASPSPEGEKPEDAPQAEGSPRRDPDERRSRKLERKLSKMRGEEEKLRADTARLRRENESLKQENDGLRQDLSRWKESLEDRVEEALQNERARWFQRYREAGVPEDLPDDSLEERFQAVRRKADQALECQRQADERYGTVSAIRRRLLDLELYLREMDRIASDSLMVHPEVSRARKMLVQERERLLELPGMEKVLGGKKSPPYSADLPEKLRRLEAVPENLPGIVQLEDIVKQLSRIEVLDEEEARFVSREAAHKKRQILASLYQRFHPEPQRRPSARSMEEFVRSGESRSHDVYVDAYNILLTAYGHGGDQSPASLASMRERFIAAASLKKGLFRTLHLFFDGLEENRDRQGNLVIVYSDKSLGSTADSMIIQAIQSRRDSKALLVTADREIIQAVQEKVHALVDPLHFFAFLFDIDFPFA